MKGRVTSTQKENKVCGLYPVSWVIALDSFMLGFFFLPCVSIPLRVWPGWPMYRGMQAESEWREMVHHSLHILPLGSVSCFLLNVPNLCVLSINGKKMTFMNNYFHLPTRLQDIFGTPIFQHDLLLILFGQAKTVLFFFPVYTFCMDYISSTLCHPHSFFSLVVKKGVWVDSHVMQDWPGSLSHFLVCMALFLEWTEDPMDILQSLSMESEGFALKVPSQIWRIPLANIIQVQVLLIWWCQGISKTMKQNKRFFPSTQKPEPLSSLMVWDLGETRFKGWRVFCLSYTASLGRMLRWNQPLEKKAIDFRICNTKSYLWDLPFLPSRR